jgi:hypothetical protein
MHRDDLPMEDNTNGRQNSEALWKYYSEAGGRNREIGVIQRDTEEDF